MEVSHPPANNNNDASPSENATIWPDRLPRADAARYLWEMHGVRITRQTMARWAVAGDGPPMVYFGRTPLYPKTSLDEWIRERLSKQVSSTAARKAALQAEVREASMAAPPAALLGSGGDAAAKSRAPVISPSAARLVRNSF
jgi:hypothetical protein